LPGSVRRILQFFFSADAEDMDKLKAITRLTAGLAAVTAIALGWLSWQVYRYAHEPCSTIDRQVLFAIAPGETLTPLALGLQTRGLIASPLKFKLLARIRGDANRLKAGEYQLSLSMSPLQILDILVSGKAFLHRLIIPEGFNAQQIAAEVADQGLGKADEFLALVNDPATARRLHIEAQTLEGYLFPDTYYFPKGVAALTIIEKMVGRFQEQFQPDWQARARQLHLSVHQIVTLASIIEKETGDPAERPVISSVFYNRLKKKMRLESDPTVIYGLHDFDGNLKRSDLSMPTPYNTYIIKGLPPGPIASPGRESLKAALYPAQTNYLFFVSKKDHTHYFSATIEEHNRAVRKYQLHRRARPAS
jgi:peptidoglycan lytic transglycosylase G